MQRVLANEPVKTRIGQAAVGLAIDCDAPPDDVQQIMAQNLPDARTLPFVALLTSEGEWVDGYSGYKEANDFLAVLDKALKSPLLTATPEVRKQLEKHAKAAAAAVEHEDWKAVMRAAREAAKSNGRCPERDAIRAAATEARAWVAARFAAVQQAAVSGDDLKEAKQILTEVRAAFTGEPEAEEAAIGIKALARLNRVRAVEARGNPAKDLRPRTAKEFEGTRWTALFDEPAGSKKDG